MSTKVVELGTVDDMAQDVICTSIFTQEFAQRRESLGANHSPLLMLFDDAQRLVQEGSSLAEYIRITRALRMNFAISLQSAEIASSILSNVPTRFLGRTSSSAIGDHMARNLGNLSYEERRWVCRNLKVGRFLGCTGSAPFVFQVPDIRWADLPGNPSEILKANPSKVASAALRERPLQ